MSAPLIFSGGKAMMTFNKFNKSLLVGVLLLASTAWALPDLKTTVTGKRPTPCEKHPQECGPSTPPTDPPPSSGHPGTPDVGRGPSLGNSPARFEGKSCSELKQQEQTYLDAVKVAEQNLQESKERKASLEKEMNSPHLSDQALKTLGATQKQTCEQYQKTADARLKEKSDCGETPGGQPRPCRAPTATTQEINEKIKCENATNENRTRNYELQTLKNGISKVGGDIRERQTALGKSQQNLDALRKAEKDACAKPSP
jgi:hypothetical protein